MFPKSLSLLKHMNLDFVCSSYVERIVLSCEKDEIYPLKPLESHGFQPGLQDSSMPGKKEFHKIIAASLSIYNYYVEQWQVAPNIY